MSPEKPPRSMWGTPRSELNPEEFCQGCERETPFHYEGCPDRMAP